MWNEQRRYLENGTYECDKIWFTLHNIMQYSTQSTDHFAHITHLRFGGDKQHEQKYIVCVLAVPLFILTQLHHLRKLIVYTQGATSIHKACQLCRDYTSALLIIVSRGDVCVMQKLYALCVDVARYACTIYFRWECNVLVWTMKYTIVFSVAAT